MEPESFWRLTPREWLIRMDGAHEIREASRISAAISAWVGANCDKAGLDAWIGSDGAKMPPEMLEGVLKGASFGMNEVSLESYLAYKRSLN